MFGEEQMLFYRPNFVNRKPRIGGHDINVVHQPRPDSIIPSLRIGR